MPCRAIKCSKRCGSSRGAYRACSYGVRSWAGEQANRRRHRRHRKKTAALKLVQKNQPPPDTKEKKNCPQPLAIFSDSAPPKPRKNKNVENLCKTCAKPVQNLWKRTPLSPLRIPLTPQVCTNLLSASYLPMLVQILTIVTDRSVEKPIKDEKPRQ